MKKLIALVAILGIFGIPIQGQVGITAVASSAIESSHILKASPGVLYSVYVTATTNGLLMVFNSATVPVDGAVTPIECIPLAVTNGIGVASLNYAPGPASTYSTGIVVVYSTGTNCFNKTASATAFFHATFQ